MSKSKSNKKYQTRNSVFPLAFVSRLEHIEKFSQLSTDDKFMVARFIWLGLSSKRDHHVHEEFKSYSYTERNEIFGNKARFEKLNEDIKFVETKPWSNKNKNGQEGATIAYKLTTPYTAQLESFLSNSTAQYILISGDNKRILTPPRPVLSIAKDRKIASDWSSANKSLYLGRVPINIYSIETLIEKLTILINKNVSNELINLNARQLKSVRKIIRDAQHILVILHERSDETGFLLQQYREIGSGRICGFGGIHLQYVKRVLRFAALDKLVDIDIENCHYAILNQWSKRYGFNSDAIEDYLLNKKLVRNEIATTIGITIEQVKKCLLSVVYGSRTMEIENAAIPEIIGLKNAIKLYKNKRFMSIAKDVYLAAKTIIDVQKKESSGGYRVRNMAGKFYDVAESEELSKWELQHEGVYLNRLDRGLLAHLLQGVEVMALKSCIEMHSEIVVLAQHDGFTCLNAVDIEATEKAIRNATSGFELKLTQKPINFDSDNLEKYI